MRMRGAGSLPLALLVVAGCGGEAEGGSEAEAPAAAEAPELALPDTTAEAVWAHLTASDYQSWELWPGTDALYAGTEPHGMLLTTYVNSVMAEALAEGRTTELADGAIVVKDNYMPDSTFAASTVMYQAPGDYNAEGNGWWYLKRNADESVDAAGGAGTGCHGCHVAAEGEDYLFTSLPESVDMAGDGP